MKTILLILTLTVGLLSGNLPRTHFFRITQIDGLSVNQVQAVTRDEWGYLWVGTSNGLNRYDGSSFLIHRPEPETPNRLSDSNCYALLYDATRKSLWIGTHGGGLNRYHIPTDHFEQVPIQPQKNRLKGTEDIFAILLDESGKIWFGGSCGLQVIHRGQSTPDYIPLVSGNRPDTRPCPVTALAMTTEGRVIVGTEMGLWAINNDQAPCPILQKGEADFKRCIWSLCAGDAGDLWVGCEGGSLYHLADDFRILDHFHHTDIKTFPTEGINALCRDHRKRLWIGTYGGGLLCLDPNTRILNAFNSIPDNPFSLPGDQINCLFHDPEGSVWIGTDNGLCRYEPELEKILHYGRDEPAEHTLSHADIVTMTEVPEGLWVGSSEGTIRRIRPQPNGAAKVASEQEINLSSGSLTKLVFDHQNHLWCATESGLLQLDTRGHIVKRFTPDEKTDQSIPASSIITLMADRQDRLWIGSNSRGVSVLHINSGKFTHIPRETLPTLSVWAMIQDHQGGFWLGSRDGLFLLGPDLKRKKSFTRASGSPNSLGSNWITSLFEDSRQRIWVGTAGAGLYLSLEPKPGFHRFDRRQGLPDDDVLSILEDQHGFIWLSTGRGLCRLDPDSGSTEVFGYHQGLGAMDFNIDAALRLESGHLAFGSSKGLDLFDPDELPQSRPELPLHIESLRINTRLIPLAPPLFLRSQLELPYSRDIIRFDFAAIDHRRSNKLTYRYRLKGWKDQWLETDNSSRQAVFGQLPPGSYYLEVMACRADGTPASVLQSLQISIPAPFWRTSWFLTLGVLCFALLSYLLIHFLSGYLRIRRFWHKTTCISTYSLGPRIGCGGMSDVFSGIARVPQKTQVAIKILREDLCDDPLSRRRFRLEAAIIDQLEHTNIVRVLERGIHDGRPYIVMERLYGVTLAQKIETEQGVSLIQAAPIITQICSALEQIHQKGILHRDLKPANIMLTRPGPQEIRVKLLDFGLARLINQSRMTRSGTVMGTLSYLAPEQISCREATAASDIFALGVLVFEMLTGVLPYTGGSPGDLLNQILIEPPPRLGDLGLNPPEDIEAILSRMMDKNPNLRPTPQEIRLCFSSF